MSASSSGLDLAIVFSSPAEKIKHKNSGYLQFDLRAKKEREAIEWILVDDDVHDYLVTSLVL